MKYNVIIFDDHAFVTDAIELYLLKKDDVLLLGKYNTYNSLFEAMKTFDRIDILIADVLTDDDIGMDVFEEVRSYYNQTKIIVYSSIKSEFIKKSLFEYGVIAIINKKESFDQIYKEIRNLNMTENKKVNDTTIPKLTPKERQIVEYLAKGFASKEIADVTNSSINTINNQKNSLLEKYECVNSIDLIVKLTQLGMLTIV